MNDLANQHCKPCEGGVAPLSADQAQTQLKKLASNWRLNDGCDQITGEFEFKNYYHTTAFVNAVAWIAHSEDHHPDISFGYKNCQINYTTHAIDGLSDNDFISAAKIDRLLA